MLMNGSGRKQILTRDNNVMHATSGLRVLLEWKIIRPDSVITDVILLNLDK